MRSDNGTDAASEPITDELRGAAIIREVVAQAENPVMLYSVGKDSSVMLHLARKAFYPSVPPFPLMHVDTRWKFQAMYQFRDEMARESGMELIVHINPECFSGVLGDTEIGGGQNLWDRIDRITNGDR